MSEPEIGTAGMTGAASGPGAMLRRAREAQGLHVAALAASLKVPPGKLEALEQDRFDLLPDATFARALAQAVCRVLKLDPAPVLAQLPRAGEGRLEHVATGLKTPFREQSGAAESATGGALRSPVLWLVALLLIGAAVIYFWPRASTVDSGTTTSVLPAGNAEYPTPSPEPATAASDPVSGSAPPTAIDAPAADTAAAVDPAASAAVTAAAPVAGPPVVLRLRESSWVEVIDAGGQKLVSRTVTANEPLALDGRFPMRLTIGNAAATELSLRGQPVDLAPHVRDNIARLELR
jgi:cytoskeleton protein RodZ